MIPMFYITNKHVSLIAGISAALLCMGIVNAADVQAEDQYLRIISQGYSRHEIDDGNVVTFFPEGVEFEYLGLRIAAGQLRFNKANRVATVEDEVTINLDGLEATCDYLVLDGAAGQLEMQGGITCTMLDPPLTLTCQELIGSFPPGANSFELQDTTIAMTGGIQVLHAEGHLFETDALHYLGELWQATTVGEFRVVIGNMNSDSEADNLPDISDLTITGTGVTASIREGEGLDVIQANDIAGNSSGLRFNAARLTVRDLVAANAEFTLENSEIQLQDFTASILRDGTRLDCTSGEALIRMDEMGLSSLLLSDAVHVTLPEGEFATTELLFSRVTDGYTFDMPTDVVFDFDLSAVSGIDPIVFDGEQGSFGGF